ncbi:MFS transporter [Ralstonia sp. UBA689]|uniref:MFS transporter n=1 Tax=Ralstonia sp. UBA689 TaxID=1947373 RepID=UPI0025D40F77|nr:MFS transporter [Ralstonia sp. UBA689]
MNGSNVHATAGVSADAPMRRRAVVAASIGNVLEIYDFIAFGIFAVPIARTFFPAGSDFAALIMTFMTFAAGFLARPLGALLLGRYADRVGRKRALSLTLVLMALGTLVPAVCPSYAAIGVAAPIIIVLGRLVQGFSAGGEVGGAVAMMVENAGGKHRGLYGSFQQMSQGGGVLVAGLLGVFMTSVFTEQQILDGGWRLAFVFGVLIGPVGWYIRRAIPETAEFSASHATRTDERLLSGLARHSGQILMGIGVMVFWTIATYVSNYFTTYAVRELHLSLLQSYLGQISYGVTMLVACPAFGALSDRTGPFKLMAFGAGLSALLAYPLFWVLAKHPSLPMLIVVQGVIALLLASYAACASRVLADIFPVHFRATGVGISYALGVTIFGGLTPLLVTSLIHWTGDKLVVGLYLSCAAIVSAVLLTLFRPAPAAQAAAKAGT